MQKVGFVIALLLFGGFSSSLASDLNGVWDLARPAIPAGFELQGGLLNDPPRGAALRRLTQYALQIVKGLAPTKSNLFRWEGSLELLQNRSVTIVLTDSDTVFHPHFTQQSPYESYIFSPIVWTKEQGEFQEDLLLVIRADLLLLNPNGELRSDCLATLVAHLSRLIYGYAQYHLQFPIKEIVRQNSTRKKQATSNQIIDRISFEAVQTILLRPPEAADFEQPLQLFGGLALSWWNQATQLSGNVGPLPVPLRFGIAEPISNSVSTDLLTTFSSDFGRALFLAYALPPKLDSRDPFCRSSKCQRFDDRELEMVMIDARDSSLRAQFLPGRFRHHSLYMPSDTILGHAKKQWWISWALGFKGPKYVLETVFWMNDLFYTENFEPRPDRLARTTLALAGEFYGVYPWMLLKPEKVDRGPAVMERMKLRYLRASRKFYDRLKAHPVLWTWLTETEKAQFAAMAKIYNEQIDIHNCGIAIVSDAEEN